jgi:glyoxylase-like metal-dependent hydrolase (beta-lactamase superfamily II)
MADLGGVRCMFLTHRDDVADHAAFQRRFGCDRVLHERDVTSGTRAVERKLTGDEPIPLAEDLVAIPVPGHTAGSAVLLYKETFLFTGDHLMASEDDGLLHASRDVCWYSWPEQIRSMERLLDFRFDWVLPGHGGSYRASSASAMKNDLERVVAEMKS